MLSTFANRRVVRRLSVPKESGVTRACAYKSATRTATAWRESFVYPAPVDRAVRVTETVMSIRFVLTTSAGELSEFLILFTLCSLLNFFNLNI